MSTETNVRLAQAVDHAKTLAWKRDGKLVCECCGKRITKAVADHNHRTQHWRGKVCYSCNTIIGYAEWAHRNPEKFRVILAYLQKYDPTHELLYMVWR